ncbi:hypothetical protein [Hyphomonas sp.]|uniref:hypothetical protein n=1 Tax=Hyphomonas sp. TaxID=87 RepID=UPI00391B4915
MPLQNRVDPFGILHAVPDRGLFMGNRGGCFHRDDQTLKDRHWASRQWIICVLEFKGRRRPLMQPGLYTELFFLDEATALAGGHRPCFECRRAEATAFRSALVSAGKLAPGDLVAAIDAHTAGELQPVLQGAAERETVDPTSLPDGAFYAHAGEAYLKTAQGARRWSFQGYGPAGALPASGQRLTPRLTCDALRAGYRPMLHASAEA